MSAGHPPQPRRVTLQFPSWISTLLTGANVAVVSVVIGLIIWLGRPLLIAVTAERPIVLPSTMENVDWRDPDSSKYCLACHGQVGRAADTLAVRRGHSQNVALNSEQLQAVDELGAVAGPRGTLVCMSCHQLDQDGEHPLMLADTLDNSALCQRCHPGHYARGTPHDLRVSAPNETNRLGQTVAEGGPCSACHLAHGFAREIMRSELDPDGYCLPCHSAYHVAQDQPRATMQHPVSRCLECHDPHDASHGEFLAKDVGALCRDCHDAYAAGPAGGMHPVGRTSGAVPVSLASAGAHPSGQDHDLTCVVCHDPHEAPHRQLLRITPDTNTLCLTCHEDKLLANTHDGVLPRHGQQPKLDDQQRAVVESWGNPVGPESELLCISCHGVHSAEPNTQVLSFKPKYGETCSACHPHHEGVTGSPHDLRINFADLPNTAGLLPIEAGVCSPCHMAHQFPQERVATAGDPAGQCVACHREGACGQAKVTGGVDHPNTICSDCHDPHVREFGHFLKADPTELCAQCHADSHRIIGGPHDVRINPSAWPAEAVAAGGPCLSCHVPHGGDRADLFRFRTPTGFGNHDGVCLTCHQDAGWGLQSDIAAIHPRKVDAAHAEGHVDLSLVPTDIHGDKRIGCRTCHDPHGGGKPEHLARVTPDRDTTQLCLDCHVEKRLIRFTGHSPASLDAAGYTTDSCKPCHAMHARPDGSYGKLLSPRFLLEIREIDDPNLAADGVPCQVCHTAGGHAPTRSFTQHPEVVTMNIVPEDDPSYMPLFAADGHVDPQGQITCRTCHISHGRVELLELVERQAEMSAAQRSALKAQVRPFVAPNICTTCHGPDARAHFARFHQPARRGGRLDRAP